MNQIFSGIDLDARPRIASLFRLQWEPVQNSWVLLYPEGMVKLNGSAGEILKRLDGKTSVQTVVDALESDFGTPGLGGEVLDFLAIARRQGWIKL
jgi:pyrroloquinoline quinone biosynthesis protein D